MKYDKDRQSDCIFIGRHVVVATARGLNVKQNQRGLTSTYFLLAFKNWFFPLAALILIGDVSVAKFVHWDHGTFLEAGLLIDFMVVLPVLYWIFGNRTKAAAARSLALACFGIWICSKTVPTEQQDLLLTFVWLRYVGIGALTLLELGIVASLFKAVMLAGASRSDAQALLEERGMPPWLARIMATEATLWRKLWDFVRRVCGVR